MNMVERRDATQKTLDASRHREFAWGGSTCVHLLREHLINMGYNPPEIPEFDTLSGAVRAMKSNGWDDVADMLDAQGLIRLGAPAFMKVGDVAVAPGEDGLDAIFICAGGARLKMFGWVETRNELSIVSVDLDNLIDCWGV